MRSLFILSSLFLAACSGESPQAGGLTPGESEALDDAAEMLDESNQPKPGEAPEGDDKGE